MSQSYSNSNNKAAPDMPKNIIENEESIEVMYSMLSDVLNELENTQDRLKKIELTMERIFRLTESVHDTSQFQSENTEFQNNKLKEVSHNTSEVKAISNTLLNHFKIEHPGITKRRQMMYDFAESWNSRPKACDDEQMIEVMAMTLEIEISQAKAWYQEGMEMLKK